jgi:hypothetical protein
MIRKWKVVPSRPELEVSSLGEVRFTETKELLKIYLTGNYPVIWIKNRSCKIHRMILEAFLGPANGLWTNHKDGNKHNNNLENLEYVTPKENEWHKRYILGKNIIPPAKPGSQNGWSKLTEDQVIKIRELYKTGEHTYLTLANLFNVTPACIAPIIQGKGWKHIDPGYRKPNIPRKRVILNQELANQIRLELKEKTVNDVAEKYGVSRSTIYQIRQNRIWRIS